MVAKLSTIKRKIKNGEKLGFSERARAVNKGLLPSKAKKKKEEQEESKKIQENKKTTRKARNKKHDKRRKKQKRVLKEVFPKP